MKEANREHICKVLDLSLFDIMELSDESLVDANLFDNLYYHLLDNAKLRKLLKKDDYKPSFLVSLEKIKNIVIDIKSDDEWVNDSQTQAEYKGVCDGLDMLVNHLEKLKKED
jgi:hypothetical protein